MNYSGIDLHANNSMVSVTYEEDRVLAERRLPNNLATILEFLAPWREDLVGVVVGSTFNWYWLVDGLQAAGFEVHLAHTTAIKKDAGLKHSAGETDARYIAQLLRLGITAKGHHPGARATGRARSQAQAPAAGAQSHRAHPRRREHPRPPMLYADAQ